MIRLIQQGLHRQNLLELISVSEGLIQGKPAIYGRLVSIFRLLEQEYEPLDAIDTSRYNTINSALKAPLINLLDAEDQSAHKILQCLDEIETAFEDLSH